MGQACCSDRELFEKDKLTLDMVNSKSKLPQKPAQERETSYVGQDSPNDLIEPNEEEPMEMIIMGSPSNRSGPKSQDLKELNPTQVGGVASTMTSDRVKYLSGTQETKKVTNGSHAVKLAFLEDQSPRPEPPPREVNSHPMSKLFQACDPIPPAQTQESRNGPCYPPCLAGQTLTQAGFRVCSYEREHFAEKFLLPDDLLALTSNAVRQLLNVEGCFAFRLDNYCGKELPVHQAEFEDGTVRYYGQGYRIATGRFIKEGKGHLITRTSVFSGYFSGDKTFGPGVFVAEDEAIASYLMGFWNNDKLDGDGMLVYDSGYRYVGRFIDGLQHGTGAELWADQSTYQGEYRAGLKHGHGECKWPGQAHYVGEFNSGLFEGHGRFSWANGNFYEGMWAANQIHGYGVFTWADGMIYEGEYKEGKRDGQGRITWPHQMIWEGLWNQGRRILSSGRYVNLEGDCKPRNSSPQLKAGKLKRIPD